MRGVNSTNDGSLDALNGLDLLRVGRTSQSINGNSFERLSWSSIRRSIDLIEEMTIEDADACDAVNNVQRLGNSGIRWLVVSPNEKIGRIAFDELETWSGSLFNHRGGGGIHAFINYFLRQVVISGAGSAENKIAPQRTHISDIYPVDVRSLDFTFNESVDKYVVGQMYKGELIQLPSSTYQYIPLSTPLNGVPYPLPPLYSALEETDKLKGLLNSISDGISKQKLLGILTLAIKRMARVQGQSEKEWRKEQQNILSDVSKEFSKSLEKGILVHFDEVKPELLSFASEMSKAVNISEPFERRTSRSLNFAWIREHGTIASAYMSIILEKMLSEIQAVQLIVAQILNKAAYQQLYLKGIPVISIKSTLDQDAIRIWDKILKQVNAFEGLLRMGVVDKYMIGRELGYTPPSTSSLADDNNNTKDRKDGDGDGIINESTSFDNYLIQRSDCFRFAGYRLAYKTPLHIQLIKTNPENTISQIGNTLFM